MRSYLKIFLLSIPFIITTSCSDDEKSNPVNPTNNSNYQYTIPEQTDDGWETASLESVGMALEPIVNMVNMLDTTEDHQIHNILIFKDNKKW